MAIGTIPASIPYEFLKLYLSFNGGTSWDVLEGMASSPSATGGDAPVREERTNVGVSADAGLPGVPSWALTFQYTPGIPVWHKIFNAKENGTLVSAQIVSTVLKTYTSTAQEKVEWDNAGGPTFIGAKMDRYQRSLGSVISAKGADGSGNKTKAKSAIIIRHSSTFTAVNGGIQLLAGLDNAALTVLSNAEQFEINQPGYQFGPFNCKIVSAANPDFTPGVANCSLTLQPRIGVQMPTTLIEDLSLSSTGVLS